MRFPIGRYTLRRAEEDDMHFVMGCMKESVLMSVEDVESQHSDLWMENILGVTSIAMDGGMMRSEAFVLEDENKKYVGILWMGMSFDQFTCEETGYLLGIFVITELRGKGMGRSLMRCAEDWCRERGLLSLTLNVGSANTSAKEFYDRLGFSERSTVLRRRLR
ncbi:MAG: GNAT family N-acetyltransferase [Methanomassiliicoccaceae archaeon]|jgi:GNAT superfamily N-acetyltransferase|nr:GNAT family N-acetyltransferase [Methanomassiliicoccaceae archaeon]